MTGNSGFQQHEDYVQWSFWDDVLKNVENDLKLFQRLQGAADE